MATRWTQGVAGRGGAIFALERAINCSSPVRQRKPQDLVGLIGTLTRKLTTIVAGVADANQHCEEGAAVSGRRLRQSPRGACQGDDSVMAVPYQARRIVSRERF
jgi:hypothetical protein